jgi:hypothetical protein
MATTIVSNTISSAAGRLDYSMTYDGGTLVQAPTVTLTETDAVLSAAIQGASISNADDFQSYMYARSSGGISGARDYAQATSSIVGHHDVGVKNYNLYGYVTPNFAYAGQSADLMTGEIGHLLTHSSNCDPGGDASSEIFGLTHENLPNLAFKNVYQDAMAGGSGSPGKWVMADIYAPTQAAVTSSNPSDYVCMDTYATFVDPSGNFMDTYAANYLVGKTVTMKTTGLSMGYANSAISFASLGQTWGATGSQRRNTYADLSGTSASGSSWQIGTEPPSFFEYSIVQLPSTYVSF